MLTCAVKVRGKVAIVMPVNNCAPRKKGAMELMFRSNLHHSRPVVSLIPNCTLIGAEAVFKTNELSPV